MSPTTTPDAEPTHDRYRAITNRTIQKYPQWQAMDSGLRRAVEVVSQVLPFRVNEYVLENLIDWDHVPNDPIFQLTFPQEPMLEPEAFSRVAELVDREAPRDELRAVVDEIRLSLNPHPAGQMSDNVPEMEGEELEGMQHKYKETLLFFPARGQTCHAYCTYCFRWAQFVGMPEMKFEARESQELVEYLQEHKEVSDVLVTGGDPMIMKSQALRQYLEPLLTEPGLEHITSLRIGTKSPAYWPQRFVTDDDADDALRFFEEVVAAGKHLAIMGHFSHPVELEPPIARDAIRRIRDTGAEIRMQAPLIRHVNDDPEPWADIWREGVRLGMIPYYMFVERDTGARNYFEVPLAEGQAIFRDAVKRVSGLARTVRGPSMSAHPGKVRVLGTATVGDEDVFILDFLQGRNPDWVGRPFFAKYDPAATWLDDLEPAFGQGQFFFETESGR